MSVAELIKALQKMPQDAQVILTDADGGNEMNISEVMNVSVDDEVHLIGDPIDE